MIHSPSAISTALQHQRAGRFAEAEQVYKLLLSDQPDMVDALNLLGALVYEDSRFEEAQEYFERVLTLRPVAESHNSMGIVLKARGKYAEAVEHYRQALAMKPDQPEVLSNLGNVLKETGDLEAAIAVYQQAIALRPTYAEAHNNLGIIYKEQGNLEQAIQCYREALRLKPNYAEAHHNLGIVLGLQGKADEAIRYFQQAIALKPNYPDAYLNLGSTWQQQGKLEEAIAQYQQLLELKPNHADGVNSLGLALQQQGKIPEAIAAFKQALELRPNFPGVCNNLGNLLLESDQVDEAIAYYLRAVEHRPNYPEALNNLGNAYQKQGKVDVAIAQYRKALELRPTFVEALSNLGAVLKDQHKLEEAVSCLEQAISLNDSIAEIHNNLGNTYQEQKRLEEAIACYRKAVALKPDMAEVRSNLGNMLQYIGEFEEAFEHFQTAIELQPDFAGVYNNLGIARRNSGQVEAAFAAYDRALELNPDFVEAHWNKALNYLLMGDFIQGFAGYEWRFKWNRFIAQNPSRTYTQPRWDGSSLEGKTILLYSEQGMGDTIQFIRYVPLVAAQGARIIIECHPPLVNLFKGLPHIAQLIPYGEPVPHFDVHAPLMSLAYLFRSTQETLPATVPYLPIPATPALPAPPPSTLLKVGLVWDGNPENPYNRNRAVPLAELLQLADLPGVALYSLQKEPKPDDGALLQAHPGVYDLRSQLNDFTDTAALIDQLDLVISIDTAVTHLAGAIGKTTWLMLPFAPDWRWMLERADSPWYPTLRLFRQTTYGDWEPVLEAVRKALVQLVEARGGHVPVSQFHQGSKKAEKRKKKKQRASKIAIPAVLPSPQAPPTPGTTPNQPKPLPEALKVAIRHHQAGRLDEAWQACKAFLQSEPESAEGWHLMGLMAHHQRRLEDAIAHYRRSLECDPEHCDSFNNLAVALHEQGRREEAIPYYQKVLALKPDYADAHNNYANALREQGNLDSAIAHYQQAIAARPDYADAYNNLGLAYYAQEDFAKAAEAYRQAIAKRPNYPQALNHLGNALKELGHFAEAAAAYQQAIALKPDYAKAFNNWGNIFRDEGDLQTALQYYEQATAIDPDFAEAHWNKALTLLLGGDLERGFAEYEWRRHVNLPTFKSLRNFPGPSWDGAPLNGQIIYLHAEQGMGDVIQFVRYVPLVVQRGGRVVLECHNPLIQLLSCIPGVQQLVPYGSAPPGYHVQFPLLSLPHIFGTRADTVPATVPYLNPPPSTATLPTPRTPDALKVGLVWSGNPENPYNRTRAVPLQLLCDLATLPNLELYSLQKDLQPTDAALLAAHPAIHDLRELMRDFVDTAALIQQLDLVISVDTAVTHLAGALGKPVYLLLPFAPDWRWMLHREDSPWYPTMQIFRQATYGDWEPVIEQVRATLGAKDQTTAKDQPTNGHKPPHPSHWDAVNPFPVLHAPRPHPTARLETALQLYHQGQLAEAETLYRQVLQDDPEQPDALHVLGVILCQSKQFEAAIALFRQLIVVQPGFADGWRNLGGALQEQGDLEAAIAAYQQAIAIQPQDADAHQNLSMALLAVDRPEAAVRHAQQVTTLKPQFADAYYNLGYAFRRWGRLDDAIAHYRQALELQPQMAIAHKNLGHALLLKGDFLEGFREIEWRWQQPGWAPRVFPQPEWDGTSLTGKTILLYAEQGLGDTMQFVRYVPLVKAQGCRVIVECQAALSKLLAGIEGIDELVIQETPLPAFDVHAPLMSLPRLFGTTIDAVPPPAPLTAPAAPLLVSAPSPSLKVGIVWAGNPSHRNDRYRSCRLEQFQALFEVPGVTFYSLQKGEASQALQAEANWPVQDLSDRLEDFVDTAAAIAQLDLVITVDTAVAHLAGSLGKPVWVLLAFAPDWRWMVDRDDTPWYPSMRLFRQTQPSDWESVFTQVATALRETVTPATSVTPDLASGAAAAVRQSLQLTWPLNGTTDWGIAGSYLALHWADSDRIELALAHPFTQRGQLHPLHEAKLNTLPPTATKEGWTVDVLGEGLHPLQPSAHEHPRQIGLVAFTHTRLDAAAIARAQSYPCLLTGSRWNVEQLQRHGLTAIQVPLQGVDPALFYPGTATHMFGDRFLIFAGGALSYTAGADILLAAYKIFQARHPEALLLTAWSQPTASAIAEFEQSRHLKHLSALTTGTSAIEAWLLAHGLPRESFLNLGVLPYALLGQVLREVHVAVFPSRCEPGINQTLMGSLACGVPTILANNTGHQEWIQRSLGFPLHSQRPVPFVAAETVDGWGESDVEELVELLDYTYNQRQEARYRGIAAADFLREWPWQHQAAKVLQALEPML